MSPPRKAPHCKTCHKPLKGHKRGVCDTTDPAPSPTLPLSSSAKTTRPRKSAPPPLEKLPTLSPQSSQILNTLLRTNSHSAPPQIEVPLRKRSLRSASASAREAKPLHVAMEGLSANETGRKTPSERGNTLKEFDVKKEESPDYETQDSAFIVSQQLGLQSLGQASMLAQSMTSSAGVSQQLPSVQASATIQSFLDSTARGLHYPPATIFSFPADAVPELEDGAERLGLFVHVLPLSCKDEDWVPVVVGRDADAVTKLLEDSEKLAQAVRKSDASGTGEFRVGMSHIVAGTLGALATWAGLAYS